MDELLAMAAARSITYARGVPGQPVFPSAEAVEGLQGFVETMPEEGIDAGDVLDRLDRLGSPATVATTGGRYFGFVTGGAYPIGVAAAWLSAAWDQNAALGVMSPTAAVLDTVVGGWLRDAFGLPATTQHQFVTGTSVANAVCLAAARDRLLHDLGWDSVHDGLVGAPPIRIVVSEGAHSSITKALGFVGLGRRATVTVAADDQGRLDPSSLPEPGEPTLVVAQAGNVNSGSSDPFAAIADHFDGSPYWMHVDGAFGLWAATSPKLAHMTAGVDRAHSWATDMHKWLNTTYDSAVAIVRDREDLHRTFHVGASYIPDSPRLEPVNRGPDMSQGARAIEAWAVLAHLGRSGLAAHSERLCDHATSLAERMRAGGVEVPHDVVLNQVMVRLDSDEHTDALIVGVQRSGAIWCGGSTWHGRTVMRISVSSWATTVDDIDIAAETILRLAAEIRTI